MSKVEQKTSPGETPVKLTFTQLAIIVGSALAAHPEAGEYQIAFAFDPETGDLDCTAVSPDGNNGWKIFTNSTVCYDFPVVVKNGFNIHDVINDDESNNGWTGNKIYTIRKKKVGRGWKRFKEEFETRITVTKNLTWDEANQWIEDDVANSSSKWPELGEAKKVYFDDAIDGALPVLRWKMGNDDFGIEYDLFYNLSLTKGSPA